MDEIKKSKYRIITLSIIVALSFWVIDALIDYLVHYDKPLLTVLFFNSREVYFRLFASAIFLLSGFWVAKAFSKQKYAELELQNTQNYLNTIIETEPECIKLIDSEGIVQMMNRAGLAMIEADSLEQVQGKSIYDVIAPEYRQEFKSITEGIFEGKTGKMEFEVVGLKGRRLWLETHAVPLRNAKEEIIALLAITRDISERKKAEEALRNNEDKYRSLVESTNDSIYLVDKDCKYLYMNKNHITRMGFSEDEYLGHTYNEFHSPDETKYFMENVDKVFKTDKSVQHEHKSRRDGRYFLQTLSPVIDADGKIVSVTVVSKDINKLKQMEEKLHVLSITDELTGLFNRRGFLALADQHIKLANRNKTGIFMLYADLDSLKSINDTYGHKTGDLALIDMANFLKKCYRDSDIIARIGGDEFVVIPVGTAGDNIGIVRARYEEAFTLHNQKIDRAYTLSASAGIVYYDPENPCSLEELLAQADKMMYEQKRDYQKS